MLRWTTGARGRDTFFAWAVLLPTLLLLALVVYLPAISTLLTSFQFANLRMPDVSEFVGLDNYLGVLTSSEFIEILGRSLLLVVLVVPALMLVALGGALLLNESFPGRAAVRTLVLLPWVLPPVVNGFLWAWLLNGDFGALNGMLYQLGIIDSYQYWLRDPVAQVAWVAVAQVWTRYAMPMIIILAGLQLIPDHLYEAAQMDGANAWQRLWHVTLPLLRPSFALAATVEFVMTFHIFDLVFTMSPGGMAGSSINPYTKTVMVLNYEMVFTRLNLGVGAALAYIILIASLAAGVVLVERMYRTGVK